MAAETPKTLYFALSNPEPGKEKEYNDWYTNVHLPEVVAVEGFVSARRYKLAEAQTPQSRLSPLPYQYLAIYEVEAGAVASGKAQEIMDKLAAAVPHMNIPSELIDLTKVSRFLVEAICDTVVAPD